MTIYQIVLSKRGIKSQLSQESLRPFKDRLIKVEGYDCLSDDMESLPFSNDYMLKTYGISLSPAEIACFHSHKRAWDEFARSSEDWCLVIEDDTIIKCDVEQLDEIVAALPDDWHIFFPYDNRPGKINFKNREPYALGKQWGAYAYFINKKSLPFLNELSCIQPIDDELVTRSFNGNIHGYFFETELFETDNAISFIGEQKRQQVLAAMLNVDCWNAADKSILRNLLRILSEAASNVGAHLILEGGTLLGHIRHGQVIQWDDDVDLVIPDDELDAFLARIHTIQGLHYAKVDESDSTFYYKIWQDGNHPIDGFDHTWPCVDLWTFTPAPPSAIFHSIGKQNHELFMEDLYPLQLIDFEGSPFYIPSNYDKLLTLQYPLWKSKMRIYPYSHRYEKSANFPLSVSISVDSKGRIQT